MYSWRFYRKLLCCRRMIAEQAGEENALIFHSGGKMGCLTEGREVRDQIFLISFTVVATLSNT